MAGDLENCGFNPDNKSSANDNYSDDLSIILNDFEKFQAELWNIKKTCSPLFYSFLMWPIESEWRPESTFKNPEFQWSLGNRLDVFRDRLNSDYPQYKDIIGIYCRLYQELGKNPCLINKTSDIKAKSF